MVRLQSFNGAAGNSVLLLPLHTGNPLPRTGLNLTWAKTVVSILNVCTRSYVYTWLQVGVKTKFHLVSWLQLSGLSAGGPNYVGARQPRRHDDTNC